MLQDPHAWQSLFCIRCGACLNACPVYRRVGGWAYGWVYPGPIGSILTPHLVGLEKAGKLPFASSLCGACGEVCPVKIDIPHQLVHLRHRAVNEPSPMNSWTGAVDVGSFGPGRWAGRGATSWRCGRCASACGWQSICPGIPASSAPGPAAASCRKFPAPTSATGGGETRINMNGDKSSPDDLER